MENFERLQSNLKSYIEEKLDANYDFNLWKETLVCCRNNQLDSAIESWDFFKNDFTVINFIVDVRATEDEWTPTLHIEFRWDFGDNSMRIRAMLVRNAVQYVQVVDMLSLYEEFGDDYDFSKQFEQMKLIEAIRGRG